MAVIQTIRTKYAKLTTMIIVIALLGFILMDFGKSGGSRSTTIGEVNGDKIDYTEYEAKIRQREEDIKRQNPGFTIDEDMQAQIRDQVWRELVNEKILADINDKLGLTVSKAELNDLLTGANPDPMVRQAFTDPNTGIFNPQEVSANIQRLRKDPQMKDQWEAFENDLIQRRYTDKFNTLVRGAVYVPTFILENKFIEENEVANLDVVRLPYTMISDEEAKVSDAEIKAYMQKHSKLFEVKEPARSIEYVAFKIIPSHEDSARILNSMATLKEEFAEATDPEAFVNRNSERPVPVNYFTKDQLSNLPNADELNEASVNTVVGPFYDGSDFVLAKVLEKRSFPDSVKARHILVQTKVGEQVMMTDSAAKLRIDSAVALIKSGVPFDSVVQRYSDDAGSKETAGEYEFSIAQKPGISKEFGDFIFEGTTGGSKTVKVENESYSGYHYIEILSQSAPSPVVKLAFISKELSPDKATYNDIYSKATQFSSKVSNGEDFEKTASSLGVRTMMADGINQNSYMVSGLGSARDLVRWAYEGKIGDVSSIYTVGDNYVIAKLTGIQEKGLMNITDETRPMLSANVMKEKKAKLLMDKYKATGSLEGIAKSAQQTVEAVDSIRFSQSFIPSIGNEGKVVGYAFFKEFKTNSLSPAIPGNEGVYFVSLKYRSQTSVPKDHNFDMDRQMLNQNLKGNAEQMLMRAIREGADVKDMRHKLY